MMINIYAVILGKMTSLQNGCFTGLPGEQLAGENTEAVTWITQGHFDVIQTYALHGEGKNIFQVISENNQRVAAYNGENIYFHPLYLISDPNDTAIQDEKLFWQKRSWFFAAVRIHLAESVHVNQLYQALMKQLPEDARQEQCRLQTYRTIELSDMILAVKSNHFGKLLKFVLSLRKYPEIGKVYTYCGVSFEKLQTDEYPPDQNDMIDLFSMRFSVREFMDIDSHLDKISDILGEKNKYSVIGVDDIVINWEELPVHKLIDLYRRWFVTASDGLNFSEKYFSDITTRLGSKMENNVCPCIENPETKNSDKKRLLEQKCRELMSCIQEIHLNREKERKEIPDWFLAFSELVRALHRMSRTAILDEFVYLMLPGAQAFLANINVHMDRLTKKDIQLCRRFIENWDYLMEHVMRIEGQLSHNPEIRPVLYDFPLAMLEYTLTFLGKAANLLQKSDEFQKQIRFLLVPRLCGRIEAQELYPWDYDKELPGLVMVTIPWRSLYTPKEVQRALCHEVAHFTGEKHRMREQRVKYYADAVAELITKVIFARCSEELADAVRTELIKTLHENQQHSMIRMCIMEKNVLKWLDQLLLSRQFYVLFVMAALRPSYTGNELIEKDLWEQGRLRSGKLKLLLKDLSTLFREVYADVCMLYLLPEEDRAEEYIRSLNEELNTGEYMPEECRYEQFSDRIYVSLTAVRQNIPWSFLMTHAPKLYEKMKQLEDNVKNNEEGKNLLLPTASIIYLLQYAEKCGDSLAQQFAQNQERQELLELREIFVNVASSDLKYMDFQNIIEEYRKKIL